MKKQHFYHLALVFIFTLITHFSNGQTVYVTEKGKKFHKKNCSVVNEGKKGIELSEAKNKGYEPCNSCKPDQAPASSAPKKESADTKKKTK